MQTLFPPDSGLPTHHLAACFNNTSATYKFYWLLAILECVQNNKKEIDKLELFARMISNLYYIDLEAIV